MARPIVRKLRFWERAWAKAKERHAPGRVAIIAVGADVSADARKAIEVSFAFSQHAVTTVFWEADRDFTNFIDELVDAKAQYFLSVGRNLSSVQKRVLRYLEIESASISPSDIFVGDMPTSADTSSVSNNIRKLKERRNAVYVHAPKGLELGEILYAYSETKRTYPDLLLLLTGVKREDIETQARGFLATGIDAPKSKLQLCDILYDQVTWRQEAWAIAANVCVLAGREGRLDEKIQNSLELGASVVVLGAPRRSTKTFEDLEGMGAIWSVKRAQGLASALAQALEPSKAALTVMQAMDYYHGEALQLQNTIDDLFSRAS